VTVAARLAAFAVVLALVVLAGYGLGRAVGPVGADDDSHTPGHTTGTERTP
jgi:hypothetical protein